VRIAKPVASEKYVFHRRYVQYTVTAAPATENITADDQIAGYHLKYYEIIHAVSVV